MNKRTWRNTLLILGFLLISTITIDLLAQCPMCKMAASSNLANGGSEGRGLNTGILYMLAIPYILIFTIGIIWWRRNGRYEKLGD